MQRPRRANGRLRKVRTHRKSACRWETVAALCLPVCSLPLRPRLPLERRRAGEEGAVGVATAGFCRPKPKLRRLHPPMLLGGGGGYVGFLPPKTEASPPPPANAAGRGGRGFGNPAASYQRIRQLGVTYLLGVGIGGSPWTEENVRRTVPSAKEAGLVAYNAMINVPVAVIYGKETRAKDMEPFLASIEPAGKGGLTVVEYNFYAHRAIEGYYETVGRAKAGYTGFDYELEL